MTATTTDRLDGLASSTAVKGPCKAASTANLTLSGAQTVNSVSIVEDDRVLVTGQTDGTENGIYVASTGAWRRAKDFSSNNDIRTGTQVRVNGGTNAGIWVLTTSDPVTIDTSTITFTRDTSGALMAANNLSDVASAIAALWNLRNNGADMSAASTLVLNNATGDQVDVTGNTTITAVTLSEDREVWVRFTGTPQITVGASLVGNNGGSNITMAAGDIARFRGYAAGVVRFTVFRLSGQAVANPTGMASLTTADQVLTGGVIPTPDDLGTQTTGTLTLNPGNGPLQRYINNGAHTLAPGSNNGSILLQVTNGASAGAVTTSGFTKVVGAFTTTDADDFMCSVVVNNGFSLLTIQALQ